MTFKEMALRDEHLSPSVLKKEGEVPLWRNLFENQSPIMKLWFFIMFLNLIFVLWLV